MRRVWLAVLVAVTVLVPRAAIGQAGPALFFIPAGLDAFNYEDLAVSNAAKAFTAATYSPANAPSAKAVVCIFETANIRYRYDGTAPTTTSGYLVTTTDLYPMVVVGINNIIKWRGIRTTGVDAVGRCTYLR